MSIEIKSITYTGYIYSESITMEKAFERLKENKLVTLNELEGFEDKVSIVLYIIQIKRVCKDVNS